MLAGYHEIAEIIRREWRPHGQIVSVAAENEWQEDHGDARKFDPDRGVATVVRTTTKTFPVSIYLADEATHDAVEVAVVNVLRLAGASIIGRDDPILGSWFQSMTAQFADRELDATAAHAADSRVVPAHDAQVTATLLQHLGPIISALHPTRDAVVRLGGVLIVKREGRLVIQQLTAAQQLRLDDEPHLAHAPHDVLTALEPSEYQR